MLRTRRLRRNAGIRALVRETAVTKDDLIYPLFVRDGERIKEEIRSMPGNYRFSVDELLKEAAFLYQAGLRAVLLFGIPEHKDCEGTGAYCEGNIVARAAAALKQAFPELYVIADVCLCEYTDHGHCGVLSGEEVDNDSTLPLLAKAAVSYAAAGVDMIAPSDMMDGRIAYIRRALDEKGFSFVPIMAYSAKYCSAFYGPFREAADSAPKFGDRKGYQMDPANGREGIREILYDVEEGADIVMVKPALVYLDVIKEARGRVDVPVAAYQVSGEYAMIMAADACGYLDGKRAALESLTAIKRAGADLIITYFAKAFVNGELF